MKISIIGAGYVGLVSGVCFAEKGNSVTIIERNPQRLSSLNDGRVPFYEPDLEDMLTQNVTEKRLFFTDSIEQGIEGSEIVFLAVGTPSNEDGTADLSQILDAAKQIAEVMQEKLIIAIKSTVPIGTSEQVRQLVRDYQAVPIKFEMASCPEFLREGSALQDFFHADRFVIGTDSEWAKEKLIKLHEPFGAPIICTDIPSAEMIKYASNAFLATKISFINEIAAISEKVGATIDDVAKGMGMDKRIGTSFLRSGIGYGGSCFPKDTRALIQIAKEIGHDFDLLKSVVAVNQSQRQRIVDLAYKVSEENLVGKKVAVLGLAFKPNTDDMREAPSIDIIHGLQRYGAKVKVYDPIAMDNAKAYFKEVEYGMDPYETVQGADLVMLLTEWREFYDLNLHRLKEQMKNPIFIDGRNVFSNQEMKKVGFCYYSIGRKSVTLEKEYA
jgi:UDPglucose 6-dehydrogenase